MSGAPARCLHPHRYPWRSLLVSRVKAILPSFVNALHKIEHGRRVAWLWGPLGSGSVFELRTAGTGAHSGIEMGPMLLSGTRGDLNPA